MEDTNTLIKNATVDIISIISIWGMFILHINAINTNGPYYKYIENWTNIGIISGVFISRKYINKYSGW